MESPAQGERSYDVPVHRPVGSPLADAFGASDDGTGAAKTLAALKALYSLASQPTSRPAATGPAMTPKAAKAIATDVKKMQVAFDAESDPVEKSLLGQKLTQLRLRAAFTPGFVDAVAKESDLEKFSPTPLCSNCHGAKTVAAGNFERVTCPRCQGAGRISPGDGAANHAAATKGLSSVSKKLWASLDKDMATAKTSPRDKVAKSIGDNNFQTFANWVRQNRQTR